MINGILYILVNQKDEGTSLFDPSQYRPTCLRKFSKWSNRYLILISTAAVAVLLLVLYTAASCKCIHIGRDNIVCDVWIVWYGILFFISFFVLVYLTDMAQVANKQPINGYFDISFYFRLWCCVLFALFVGFAVFNRKAEHTDITSLHQEQMKRAL